MELGLQEVDKMYDLNFNDANIRRDSYYADIGRNIEKLRDATEVFAGFMRYLRVYREINNFKLKVGTFEYDEDWTCEMYCHMEDDDSTYGSVYFTEENHSLGFDIQRKYKTLTELCHGDEFFTAEINIDYKPINEFLYLLDSSKQDDFSEILAETHAEFW